MYCKTAFLLSAVLVLGLAGIPHQADAATRYVDAVHGNDSYPGTSTQPWKSMSKATGAVSPGDVVYLRPGNYGVVTIDRGYGTAGAWVTYQADPSTVRARAGTWYEGTISRPDSTRDVVFTGLYLAPRASGSYAAGHYITLDGVNVVGSEVRFQRYVAYFVLKNCNIFGAMPADPVYHLSNERTLRAVYFDMESAGSDFHNVSIDSCYMELVRTGVMMSAQFRDNVIIRNCHIRDTNSSCVHLQDYETNVGTITVDGCHLELQILKADTVKLSTTVDAPVSSAPNRMFKYAGADPTYSYWADVEDLTTGRREVRRVSNIDKSTNTVTLDKALSFGMARGDKVRFFDANHGSGIAIRCGRLAIRNNRIHNTGATAGIYNYLDGAGNLLIENNLVYDVVQGSTIVNFGDNPIGNNVTIRNNTFVGRRAASYPSQPQYRYGPTFRFSAYTGTNQATLNVSNNIFVGGAVGAPSNSGICRNNICYYASGYESDSSGGNRGNLVYYQGQSYPYEPAPFDGSGAFFAGGANFDKAFTGHHGYNFNQAFQLASGSKAIGFAAATYSSKTDILNRTRDSQPDDGCYEYGAGSVPSTPTTPTTPTAPTNPTSPTTWGSRTIGTSTLGNLVRDGSTFKVTGNGENIWGTADGFHFVYRELSGDGSITARVTGTGAGTSIWAKGGVMIRDSLTAGSKHAMMALLSGGGNDARFQWRSSDGGQSYMGPDPSSVVKPPYWVKVVRAGNYLSGYLSADGVTWRQLGPTKAIYMANPVYVGLCVSARAGGQLRTFTFDNVSTTGNVAANSIKAMAATPAPAGAAASTSLRSVRPTPAEVVVSRGTDGGTTSKPAAAETDTERSDPEPAATSDALVGQAGPSGWWSETIGTAAEGNAVINGDSFEVAGGGADIWGTADGFHYLYKQLTGDGSMIARVVGNGAGSNTWAKGGVMIRNTTAAGSEHAMMVVTGGDGNGASFQWRPAADGVSSNSDNAGAAVTPPHWVKIERVGNQFSAFLSADGQTWEPQGQAQTIDMTDPVCIGLCVTSHASGELRTYTFDNVSFTGQVSDRPPQLKAYDPIPADGSMGSETPLFSWMPGETAVLHNVYFGATPELTEANLMAASQPINVYYHVPGLEPGVTYYWRVDEIDAAGAVTTGDVWSVTATPRTACNPVPADDAQGVFPAPTLHWAAGQLAVQHQVYFSSDFADVNEGAAEADGGLVDETAFYPGVLRASTTYYWRVDEVQPDGTVLAGPVWSLTTDAGVVGKVVRQWWSNIGGTAVSDLTGSPDYPNHPTGSELVDAFEGPVDWADNYGTRLYGWLTPPESGEYTFWVSGDDAQELWLSSDADPANASIIASVASWTASREWEKEAGQKSAAITLQAGRKYFIQVLGKEGGGGDSTAVAWQGPGIDGRQVISGEYVDTFALPPLHAFSPNPAHGATDVVQTPVLSWSAGEQAEHHEIYFGGDQAAVAEADAGSVLFLSRQAENAVEVGALGWGETYYWRVDEVGAAETWKGTVWSFTTANFIPIDDMESYTDEEGSRIYEAWIDGYTSGNSGSVVGYLEAPFAEQQIVHGGRQSMPLEYNNAAAPFYSEATLTLAAPQDWTANGVTDLSLWFRGHPVSFMETADGAITMSAAGADIWGTADQFRYAYQGLSGDGSIVVKVESIVNTDAWAKAGVIIREMLDPSSAFAYVVVTPGQGVSFGWRSSAGGECGSATMAGIHAPQWVRLTRTGNTFTAQYSSDGAAWQDVADAEGRPVSQDIAMAADVTAGLCVTSHNPGAVTTARTSGFTTTGGVTGPWQLADIGVAQPGNDPAPLYVVVEDSAGKAAVSVNPDPQAVLTTEWTRWNIPLSDLTGVNLAAVRKLSVGVGDKANPQAGGIGRIYLDDVRVARPEPSEEPSQPTTQ